MYEEKYGYNKPIIEQYARWLKNIVTEWDWEFLLFIDQGQTLLLF